MLKFRAKTEWGLMRLVGMGEYDVFDALAAVPAIVAARTAQEEAERYEARRLEWLAAYEPDLALCAAESDA